MNIEEFKLKLLEEFGIELTEKQIEQFQTYYRLLVEWNQKINLTAIVEEEEVYLKHFYDSLTLLHFSKWMEVEKVADVGAGAGFPSLPLKIIYPHLEITIIDSLNKRIKFLNELVHSLDLDKVNLIHSRAEDFGKSEGRSKYDVVTARAVARLNVLSELCVPLVKEQGYFISLKGDQGKSELEDAKKALQILGITKTSIEETPLPNGDQRVLIMMQKTKNTPKKYPRKAGIPNRNPL